MVGLKENDDGEMRLGNLDERDALQGPFVDDVITSMIGFGSSASVSRILKLRELNFALKLLKTAGGKWFCVLSLKLRNG